jgi:ParB family chromosome partitioning protein
MMKMSSMNLFDLPPASVQSGKSNEWYTPSKYIEAAREVMGGIDLDPASCEEANRTVRAKRYYTETNNGLSQDWTCESMWLNPPYGDTNGKSNIAIWSKRLLEEFKSGVIKQAMLLATGTPDRKWFQPLWDYPICFLNHQIIFKQTLSPYTGKSQDHHAYGSSIIYLGSNEQNFIQEFRRFGRIAKAIDTENSYFTPLSLWEVL